MPYSRMVMIGTTKPAEPRKLRKFWNSQELTRSITSLMTVYMNALPLRERQRVLPVAPATPHLVLPSSKGEQLT